ncbi:multicopper oxidase type 2 [Xanthobacter versatilis]|uniref:Multicopper oxidase type 2 n=1 Tax=Xanthobacter autotrophicus (strain ATCC BAA-1158 / Py2) TaxID=78245 RepID=A7IE96_XANP2|nr:multicopper oxidase type 2 [Xanthobacter autotrophicus Py2]
MRRVLRGCGMIALFSSLVFPAALYAQSDTFAALDQFDSTGGRLDLRLRAVQRRVIIDKQPIDTLVYETCKINWARRNATINSPALPSKCSTNLYGGPRLKLEQGDVLRIQLVNDLPKLHYDKSETLPAALDIDEPTNIHTHGLVVRPYAPHDRVSTDPANGAFGDYPFVTVMPKGGCGPGGGHIHHLATADTRCRVVDYEIRVPGRPGESSVEQGQHPSGIFWLHPHFHGLAKEQVSGGMTAMVNIGRLRDYACMSPRADGTCDTSVPLPPMRHMLLKDIQLVSLASGSHPAVALFDQDAGFCSKTAAQANAGSYCRGGEADAGRWYFTINGAVHPTWSIDGGRAEVWRIQNASANVTYDLRLDGAGWDGQSDAGGMPFQILSLDGVGLGLVNNGANPGQSHFSPRGLQRRAILMPGSRMEIVVAHRPRAECPADGTEPTLDNCSTAPAPTDTPIALVNHEYETGPGADVWPRLELARMTIRQSPTPAMTSLALATNQRTPAGQTVALSHAAAGQSHINSSTQSLCRSGNVRPLAPGERRRIYFGIAVDEHVDGKPDKAQDPADPNWKPESFVLGTSIIDAEGVERDPANENPLPDGPLLQTMNMSDAKADLCIPFGARERWELVNVSPEVHNFHIHQNRFTVALNPDKTPALRTQDQRDAVNLPQVVVNVGEDRQVLHDTIIVPRGAGECKTTVGPGGQFAKLDDGTMAGDNRYRLNPGAACRGNKAADDKSGSIDVRIDFNRPEQVGRYVFHCHILEHEDLGMMASIRVLSRDQIEGP